MDFTLNDDQQAIRELASRIFSDFTCEDTIDDVTNTQLQPTPQLWKTLSDQGLLGINISQEYGGSELGLTELFLLLEEQARRVVAAPLFSTLVLGALPIMQFASLKQKQYWLPKICQGQVKLSAAIADSVIPEACSQNVTATQTSQHWILNGEKHCIPDGQEANCILTPAIGPSGELNIFLVDTSTQGVELTSNTTSTGMLQSTMRLNQVKISLDSLLKNKAEESILSWMQQRADTALCAMQVGVTEQALKHTAEFTRERKQFGNAIGAFQAVAMQAADAYINVEIMRSTYWLALDGLSTKKSAQAQVKTAKYWACIAGHQVVHTTQHLHGGIGSDIQYPIHHYFLWAKHIGLILGGASIQITKLGTLLADTDINQ